MIKVSIIIPVFNVSEYIEHSIRSVIAQTYTDIECIIVDDGCTDDSITKCEQWIREYEGSIKFIILHHEQNRGVSAARNTGIRQATGKWLLFLDSDDEITPHCIDTLLKVGEEDEAIEMVHGSTQPNQWEKVLCDPRCSQIPSSMKDLETIKYYFFHKQKMRVGPNNKLLRRSFIMEHQLFFKEGIIWEDTLWTYYLFNCLNQICVVAEITYIYYIRLGSICTGTEIQKRAMYKGIVLNEILSNFHHGIEEYILRRYIGFFLYKGISCVRKVPEYKAAFSLYWELARKYHCRSVQIDLALAYVSSYFKNGDMVFGKLRILSRRVARLKNSIM
jgi:glycosyltransferase involved in cell wall biosynthesis